MAESNIVQNAIDYHIKLDPEAQSALKASGLAVLSAAGAALAGVIGAALPSVAPVIATMLPVWAAPLVVAGLSALAIFLQKYSQSQNTTAIGKALITPAPEPFQSAYFGANK